MNRRDFFRIAAVAVLVAAPLVATSDNGVRFYIVVNTAHPFVFGVKDERELENFKKALPTRYVNVEEARTACRFLQA